MIENIIPKYSVLYLDDYNQKHLAYAFDDDEVTFIKNRYDIIIVKAA